MQCCKVFLMDVCPTCFYERGYKANDNIESLKKVITKTFCNCVDCKWPSLATEPCQDRSCVNFLHHLCENDYDTEKFTDEFDQMHGVKKRCKSCVDKMMKACDNSLKILSDKEVENHLIKKLIVLFQITINQKVFMIVMQLLLMMMIIMKWLRKIEISIWFIKSY